MGLLIKDIKSLLLTETDPVPWKAGEAMAEISALDDAWIYCFEGTIRDFGSRKSLVLTEILKADT